MMMMILFDSNNFESFQATPENSTHDHRPSHRIKMQLADHSDDSSMHSDKLYVNHSGLLMLPEGHPEYLSLIRLQLENQELSKWKCQLQNRITAERSEIIRLKGIMNSALNSQTSPNVEVDKAQADDGGNNERLIAHYLKENTLLEQKRNILAKEIFEENKELIQLQVELAVKKLSTLNAYVV